MAAINKPKYSKDEISQRFNLKELLGYEPSEEQKKAFYELAVDKMVQRTADGKDISGKKFTQYSEEYANFKGVSRSSVDLILSGDMLSSFEESQAQKNIVKIKIAEDQTLKAYNHNVGDTLPKRTFFGLLDESSVSRILKQVDSLESRRQSGDTKATKEKSFNLADLRDAINVISADFGGFDGDS